MTLETIHVLIHAVVAAVALVVTVRIGREYRRLTKR